MKTLIGYGEDEFGYARKYIIEGYLTDGRYLVKPYPDGELRVVSKLKDIKPLGGEIKCARRLAV